MNFKKEINFSLWCDFIERDFLENKFQELVNENIIQGATSNPAIFESSISNSIAYKQQINILQANEPKKIYEELAIQDIKRASQLLNNIYENDNKKDGFISIEVDPSLCDDYKATIDEGIRLYEAIDSSNVMIKVPATNDGYKAMKELTSKGINVNATLIFSPIQAKNCAKALQEGINESINKPQAVISIFVSRFDKMCDEIMHSNNIPKSKLGIINATKCYHEINKFNNQNIRTLFASTGVKCDKLDKGYYINNLLYPNSVNTAPLSTIDNWILYEDKKISNIIEEKECDNFFDSIKSKNINIDDIYDKLLKEGLISFKDSFKKLQLKLKSI
jgi:transaldolase